MRLSGWAYLIAPYTCALALAASIDIASAGPARLLMTLSVGGLLVCLAIHDIRTLTLPNRLTFSLLACGLVASASGVSVHPALAISGALAGYLLMAVLRRGYRHWAGSEGLGGGDVKLVAALGSWLGPQGLLPLLEWAALAGIAWWLMAGVHRCLKRQQCSSMAMDRRLPFGPCLALVGWLLLLTGNCGS